MCGVSDMIFDMYMVFLHRTHVRHGQGTLISMSMLSVQYNIGHHNMKLKKKIGWRHDKDTEKIAYENNYTQKYMQMIYITIYIVHR